MTNTDQPPPVASQFPFELSESDRMILDAIPHLAQSTRTRAQSALRHLNRAWKLITLDPEMAIFRAITAEEEVATGIILSMRRHRYPNATKLSPTKHWHKQSITPLVYTYHHAFSVAMQNGLVFRYYIEKTENKISPKIEIVLHKLDDGREVIGTPDMPLNYSYEIQKEIEGKRETVGIKGYMDDLFTRHTQVKILKQIHARANQRNQLLYANDKGYPVVKGDISSELIRYKKEVFLLLWILVMIDMYPSHQLLVSQALSELLKILEIIPSEPDSEPGAEHTPGATGAAEPLAFSASGCGFVENLKTEIKDHFESSHGMAHEQAQIFVKNGNSGHAVKSALYSTLFNIPLCDPVAEWLKNGFNEWFMREGKCNIGQLLGMTGKKLGRGGRPFQKAGKKLIEETFFFFVAEEIGKLKRQYEKSGTNPKRIALRPLIARLLVTLPEIPGLGTDDRTLVEHYKTWIRREQIESLAQAGLLKTEGLLEKLGISTKSC